VRRIGQVIPAGVQALASAERVAELLDARVEVQESPTALDLPALEGRVRFDHVTFAYPDTTSAPALVDVDVSIEPGTTVALLGATGAGKSTLANLLLRLHDPTTGRVVLDGHDVRDVTLQSLRGQIGVVLQDSVLFADTIRENIAFGRPDATTEEIEAVAKAAQIHDFIADLPAGYDTEVGERGVTVSGGQKQRLAIARALLIDPRILILDDATSSVDAETEQLIQDALDRLLHGRTAFIIAQRLSTFRLADRILVIEDGCVVADGSHQELATTSPLYQAICAHQSDGANVREAG
jgi:ATP-binding cassette subfamily B protein